MTKVLFICGKNRRRSPTAEQVFADHLGIETASAGVSLDADVPVSLELLAWADLIVVMERVHKTKLAQRLKGAVAGKRLVCLDIPDRYAFMAPELVTLLRRKVGPHLPRGA